MTMLVHLEELLYSATRLASRGKRTILGITGAPGSGKSTLGHRLAAELGPERAVLVPMDGFHLANAVLIARGLRDVKGAIETFDDAGYAALLTRIRTQRDGETIFAPSFDRSLEEPIAGSIPVLDTVPLIITEGNYLLAEAGAWPRAREQLTESWFLDPEPDLRHGRLIARHIDFGKSEQEATRWALGSDEINARLIEGSAHRADRILRVETPDVRR